MVDYSPLWKRMRRDGVSQYQLIKEGIDPRILDYMKMNIQLFPETIEKLGRILDCTENEIVSVTSDVPDFTDPCEKQKRRHDFILTTIMSSFLVLLVQQVISYFKNRHK